MKKFESLKKGQIFDIEKDISKFWEDIDILNKSIELRNKKENFVLPFARIQVRLARNGAYRRTYRACYRGKYGALTSYRHLFVVYRLHFDRYVRNF
jgi:hypothetical protein